MNFQMNNHNIMGFPLIFLWII